MPTANEQRIGITEFFANPPGTNVTVYANALNRPSQPPAPSSDDEYVELVNLSAANVDLVGWSISDSVQVRHRFYDTFMIGSSNAVVVYGGPLNGFAPQLDVPVIPASENAFGFGLNNSGGDSILLRNAQSNLISRVVYSTLSTNSTMTRYADLNGNFVAHLSVSTNAATPGRQFNGRPFGEAAPADDAARITVVADLTGNRSVRLRWNAESGRSYAIVQSAVVTGPFTPLATGLSFSSNLGEYVDSSINGTQIRFYRITTP